MGANNSRMPADPNQNRNLTRRLLRESRRLVCEGCFPYADCASWDKNCKYYKHKPATKPASKTKGAKPKPAKKRSPPPPPTCSHLKTATCTSRISFGTECECQRFVYGDGEK